MFTGDGFSLNSGFSEISCTPEKPLVHPSKSDGSRAQMAKPHGFLSQPDKPYESVCSTLNQVA